MNLFFQSRSSSLLDSCFNLDLVVEQIVWIADHRDCALWAMCACNSTPIDKLVLPSTVFSGWVNLRCLNLARWSDTIWYELHLAPHSWTMELYFWREIHFHQAKTIRFNATSRGLRAENHKQVFHKIRKTTTLTSIWQQEQRRRRYAKIFKCPKERGDFAGSKITEWGDFADLQLKNTAWKYLSVLSIEKNV